MSETGCAKENDCLFYEQMQKKIAVMARRIDELTHELRRLQSVVSEDDYEIIEKLLRIKLKRGGNDE